MRIKQIICLILVSALSALWISHSLCLDKNKTDDEWYPFYFPEKLDPNSPLNIGKLVLDPPAGKHGAVLVRDGHFYFEDGTRAKFWGTNLCFSACFPTHKEAEMLANRIAYFGFNAVRLHHMDWGFEPRGIFKDVSPAYKDAQMKQTGVLSEGQLDKLDYLIYQLKSRGIYIDMNLLVSRHFTEADGVKDAERLDMAAKPASLFDSKLIGLQKKYAKDLLTHYNPYTKLKYCNDPAIALVEITNENSILHSWQRDNLNGNILGLRKKALPDYYVRILDALWNDWLRSRYGTPEKIKDAWSILPASAMAPQAAQHEVVTLHSSRWQMELRNGAQATRETYNNDLIVTVTAIDDTPWYAQLKTSGLRIEKDKNYKLKFTAKANSVLKIGVVCQQAYGPWNNLGLSESCEIGDKFQTYELPFTALDDCDNAKIAFITGYEKGVITLRDIEFQELDRVGLTKEESNGFRFNRPLYRLRGLYTKPRISDLENFYTDLEKRYFDDMVDFLKKEIGMRIPITGTQYSSAAAQASCDFIDKHAYWDHPNFLRKSWDRNDFTIHNKSMLLDPNLGIIGQIKSRDPNRLSATDNRAPLTAHRIPYTITEWNHCYPNQYAYETPVLLAAVAAKEDWDALFQFAFSHGWDRSPAFDNIQSYFDCMPNAQQLSLCALGSLLFHKGKNIAYTTTDGIFRLKSDVMEGAAGAIKNKTFLLGDTTVTPQTDGAIFIINLQHLVIASPAEGGAKQSPIFHNIIAISEIRNSGSGWNNGRFTWGRAPTQMKKMGNLGRNHP